MRLKRDKLDAAFSNLVRERAGWTCEYCKKYYPEGNRQGLHCSHFHGRRKQSVRFSPDNAAAHCFSCHKYLTENPVVFATWIEGHLGEEKHRELWVRASEIVKRSKKDKELLYNTMKSELARLQKLRNQGVTGRIEFAL